MLRHTDGQTANDVDKQDQQTSNRVAAHKLTGTIHRAVEVCLLRYLHAARFSLLLINQARVEIGIDRHLLTRHGIQSKAGTYFGDAAGTLGYHHKVDDHQNGKDHQAHHIVTADHHLTKRLNNLTRRVAPLMAVQQHHPSRGNVERQPQQSSHQQNSREYGKIQRA